LSARAATADYAILRSYSIQNRHVSSADVTPSTVHDPRPT
jgi:hypothetical protein